MNSFGALAKLNIECIRSNGVDDEHAKELQIIQKDLEVLEIIMKYDVLSIIGIKDDYDKINWYIATHKKLDL